MYWRSPYWKSVGSHQDPGAERSRALAVGVDVFDPDHDRMRDLPGLRWLAVSADVADDDRAAAGVHLRAVALTDPQPLREPERSLEPRDRVAYAGIDQNRYDRGVGDRSIGPQALHTVSRADPTSATVTGTGYRPDPRG